jgi:hypothetical protein
VAVAGAVAGAAAGALAGTAISREWGRGENIDAAIDFDQAVDSSDNCDLAQRGSKGVRSSRKPRAASIISIGNVQQGKNQRGSEAGPSNGEQT